jgi:ribulose-phosphate 3-epimerase
MDVLIAPSALSMDFSDTKKACQALEQSKASWLHFDVMDGHFVPNLTFGPQVLEGIRKQSSLFMDVHLMVTDPEMYAPVFAKAGADQITFHTEALNNDIERCRRLIEAIHAMGLKAGFTLRPATDIHPFEPLLEECDVVLVMSVNPGFGGQSFMEDQLEKVRWLDNLRRLGKWSGRIEIDGGINDKTAPLAKAAGADALVAGSYVFKGDIGAAVESLLK